MSRIGKKPIAVPSGVEVKIDGHHITVKGPKGTLEKDIRPEVLDKVARLNDMALQRGQTLAQMAVAWILANEATTSVIIGPRTMEQLKDNLGALKNTCFSDEERREVYREVMALPGKYRVPLYLYYYEGCPVKDIAALLGMKPSTVQTRLARGREQLKTILTEE